MKIIDKHMQSVGQFMNIIDPRPAHTVCRWQFMNIIDKHMQSVGDSMNIIDKHEQSVGDSSWIFLTSACSL